jgi:hypothetical protein
MIWFTADLYFGHESVIKMQNRRNSGQSRLLSVSLRVRIFIFQESGLRSRYRLEGSKMSIPTGNLSYMILMKTESFQNIMMKRP